MSWLECSLSVYAHSGACFDGPLLPNVASGLLDAVRTQVALRPDCPKMGLRYGERRGSHVDYSLPQVIPPNIGAARGPPSGLKGEQSTNMA